MNRFYLVCFDVTDHRRLRRVADELENFGTRVQRSLFECWLDDAELEELKTRMEKHIDEDEDHVRYYTLCAKDIPNIQLDGPGAVVFDPDYHLL